MFPLTEAMNAEDVGLAFQQITHPTKPVYSSHANTVLAAQVNQANQGKLQGVLVGLTNATGVIGPLLFSFILGQTLTTWDDWVWVIGSMMYVLLIVIYLTFYRNSARVEKRKKLLAS